VFNKEVCICNTHKKIIPDNSVESTAQKAFAPFRTKILAAFGRIKHHEALRFFVSHHPASLGNSALPGCRMFVPLKLMKKQP
jgi:hypothetical protein